jgi:hypothetical protein
MLVTFSSGRALAAAFALLRELGTEVEDDPTFWSIPGEEARLVGSVPNAAALVVSGEAEPFHWLLARTTRDGVTLPDIGVFVFPDQIALDYRRGKEWGPSEVRRFCQLLLDLSRLDDRSSVRLPDVALPEEVERFEACSQRFVAEQAA